MPARATWPRWPAPPAPREVLVESLQKGGALREVTLSSGQVADEQSLLALRVNGADLSLDHGYPARVIVPGAAGRPPHQVGRRDALRGGHG